MILDLKMSQFILQMKVCARFANVNDTVTRSVFELRVRKTFKNISVRTLESDISRHLNVYLMCVERRCVTRNQKRNDHLLKFDPNSIMIQE